MTTGEEDEHDAKAASERPSSSQKASTLSGNLKKIFELQTVHEKDQDNSADEEEEDKNLITAEEDERLITKEKLALLAPSIFSAPGESRSNEHRARTNVFLELKEHLVAQDTKVLQSVPENMQELVVALLSRATSIALSQKDLALVREEDCNNANLALNVATDAQQQADAIVRPLEELNIKEEELVR